MKKVFFSLVLGIATSLSLSAQIDFSSTRFGIIGGMNYSRVKNAHNPSGPRYTFQAGALALIPIDKNDQFYFQPEIVYYGARETGKDKAAKGKHGYNALYANNYISIPIYFKAFFSEAESEFFGLIGPRFNFLIDQKVTDAAKDIYDPNHTSSDTNGKANGFNFAIGAGVGFSYKRKLELSIRYDLGLSNTYKGLMTEYGGDPNIQKKKSEQVLSVGLNYIFD